MNPAFLRKLRVAWQPQDWRDLTVIVGVSGGADSVALLRGLVTLREADASGQLVVAHCNHELRGAESAGDEAFTRDLCQRLQVPLEVAVTTPAAPGEPAEASEASCRTARYAFFVELAKTRGARFVATAHTADDQAETVLHRILRGTGITGLGGIPRTRQLDTGITMLRPLLTITRHEVLEFLAAVAQPYREDASNQDPRFTRNRIRNTLFPELTRDYNPQVREALLRLGTLAADSQVVVRALCLDLIERCVASDGPDQLRIACPALQSFPLAVRREVLMIMWRERGWPQQEMSFDHWNQLAEMLRTPPEKKQHTLPGQIEARRQDNTLRLTRPDGPPRGS